MMKPASNGPAASGGLISLALGFPVSLLVLVGVRRRRRAVPRLLVVAIAWIGLFVATVLSGCGSSSPNAATAAPGTYSVPITFALSGAPSQTANVTVIVK
jgi:peptidoglycan/LPS O-acetylase OafA/YrhL